MNISGKLTVGIWSVHLKIVGKLIAETKFLVLPSTIESDADTKKTVDELVENFYKLENICILNPSTNLDEFSKNFRCDGKKSFSFCHSSEWSSFFPDPKSEIDDIDKVNAVLVP